MTFFLTAILFTAVFAVSIVSSLLGQGGGTLYTPIQVLLGVNFHAASTTSLFLIMATSFSATIVFRKARLVDWPLVLVLELATATGGFIGGFYSGAFSGTVLSLVFIVVVAAASFFMIRDIKMNAEKYRVQPGLFLWKRRCNNKVYYVHLPIALGLSFVAGGISGLTGIGGGVLKVPLMVLFLSVPMEVAVGSSALMVGITACAGFVGHVLSGHWDWKRSVMLAVLVFIGAQIGSRKSIEVDKKKLQRGFGWFLLVIVVVMCFQLLLR